MRTDSSLFEQFTLGIEEEFQIVDPDTRELRSHVSEILEEGKMLLGEQVKPEMIQSMIEVGTGICKDIKEARTDIYNRRYGNGRAVRLADFFEQTYLPTLKGSAHRDAVSRGKLVTDFFGDQLLPDITARDVKRFKSSLKSSETPRGSLRSGSTVNRYIYLLSAVCSHAIAEEIMSENPCARINDEPEKERERYLTTDEQERMLEVMVGDLDYVRAPFEVSLHTGLRKNVELLKLKVGHLNFTSRPVFFPIHGGNVEIPSNWLIVVSGKRGKYRLVPMNSVARRILSRIADERSPDAFVFDKDTNGINEYWIDKGFEDACNSARVTFGQVKPGGIIWHDLRRTFATRLRAHGVHEYDIQDLLGHSKPGVTKSMRAPRNQSWRQRLRN